MPLLHTYGFLVFLFLSLTCLIYIIVKLARMSVGSSNPTAPQPTDNKKIQYEYHVDYCSSDTDLDDTEDALL